ncbi:MAG: hypothetical protein P8Y67_12515, partial [Alphaproteobacteria bacterium]
SMPSIWRRSVALAAFFTIVGPVVGTIGVIAYIFYTGGIPYHFNILQIFVINQIIGTPFAATCGIILAIRAVFSGRVSFLESIGAALASTVIVMGITGLLDVRFLIDDPMGLLGYFALTAGISIWAAIICYWLFYRLFWPRESA